MFSVCSLCKELRLSSQGIKRSRESTYFLLMNQQAMRQYFPKASNAKENKINSLSLTAVDRIIFFMYLNTF